MNRDIGNPNRAFADGIKVYDLQGQSFDKVIDYFESRITKWYFKISRRKVLKDSNFMLMTTCSVLIDLFSQYFYGQYFSSKKHFIQFIEEHLDKYNQELTPPLETVDRDKKTGNPTQVKVKSIAEGLYVGFRCGVVHSARILEFGRINQVDKKNAISLQEWRYEHKNGREIQVNPALLLKELERIFRKYIKKLRKNDQEAVANFKKKFNFEYSTSFQ
jgi:hypothetical protein